jgi:hypothetical protein
LDHFYKIELTKSTYKVYGNRLQTCVASGAKVAQSRRAAATTKVPDGLYVQLGNHLYNQLCYSPRNSWSMSPFSLPQDAERGNLNANTLSNRDAVRSPVVGGCGRIIVSPNTQLRARRRTNANVPIVLQEKNTAEKTATVVTR